VSERQVYTPPGGPRPASSVHRVSPGQVVRRTFEGTYVIDHGTESDTVGSFAVEEEVVITPGGVRLKSLVHQIEPGAILDGTDGQHRMLHPSGKLLADFGVISSRSEGAPLMPANVVRPRVAPPALGSGWITYAYWNRPSTPISSFSTSWVVPPGPATQSNQLIYLFNGIQNATMIYQPVLQWGSNGAFGGNYWCVASWYADGQGGQAFHSNPITVSSGDVLTGVMTLTGQSPQGFSYNCSFQGINNSGYAIQNVPELWQAVETLECYNMTKCSDYPNTAKTPMASISIKTGTTQPNVVWTTVDSVTDCGQHTSIFDQGAAGHGEVDIWYQGAPYWTVGAGTVAAGANWTSWFSWGGAGDVGPQFIQAEPIQASGNLWTTQIGESLDSNGNLTYWATAQNQGTNAVQFQWRGGGR
jgi:hypothetical protein